ncbi:MAG TPA: hypothetical protein VGF53_05575 [Pseudolabrys sp.]|jgi:hypothetical protein
MLVFLKAFVFLLVLAHLVVLFASAIALALYIAKRLAIWLWRICTAKPAAKKSSNPQQKNYLSPASGSALR